MAHLAASPLIQNRRIALDPAPDRDMVNREIPLGHDLLQVAICERVSQIPANAQQYDHVFDMPSAEQCRPFLGHDTPYQISSIAFATEPQERKRFPIRPHSPGVIRGPRTPCLYDRPPKGQTAGPEGQTELVLDPAWHGCGR